METKISSEKSFEHRFKLFYAILILLKTANWKELKFLMVLRKLN